MGFPLLPWLRKHLRLNSPDYHNGGFKSVSLLTESVYRVLLKFDHIIFLDGRMPAYSMDWSSFVDICRAGNFGRMVCVDDPAVIKEIYDLSPMLPWKLESGLGSAG